MPCPTCGATNRPAANFCRACGQRLSSATTVFPSRDAARLSIRAEARNFRAPGGPSTTTSERIIDLRTGDMLFLGLADDPAYALCVRAIHPQSIELELVGDMVIVITPDGKRDIFREVRVVSLRHDQVVKLTEPTVDAFTTWELRESATS
jgi:hypothetical protein